MTHLNRDPEVLRNDSLQQLMERVHRYLRLGSMLGGITLTSVLGAGAKGLTFEAEAESVDEPLAVKVLPIKDEEGVAQYNEEVHAHCQMNARIPHGTAQLLASDVVVERGKRRVGIIVMTRVDVVLEEYLRQAYLHRGSCAATAFSRRCAAWLQQVVRMLEANGLVHGDLHIGNVGIMDLDTHDERPLLIDFGRSLACGADLGDLRLIDRYWVWRASLFAAEWCALLNAALHELPFPGSPHMAAAVGVERPRHGVHTVDQLHEQDQEAMWQMRAARDAHVCNCA